MTDMDWPKHRARAEVEQLRKMMDHARGLGNQTLADALERQIAKLEQEISE